MQIITKFFNCPFSNLVPRPIFPLTHAKRKNIGSGEIQNRKHRICTFCDLRRMNVFIEILQPDWSLRSKGKLKIKPLWEFVLKDIIYRIESSFLFWSVLYWKILPIPWRIRSNFDENSASLICSSNSRFGSLKQSLQVKIPFVSISMTINVLVQSIFVGNRQLYVNFRSLALFSLRTNYKTGKIRFRQSQYFFVTHA